MHLFLVDDETSLLALLGQSLVRQGHSVESAASVAQAAAFVDIPFDAAIIDWKLPDGNGLDIGRPMLERHQAINIVLISGYPLDATLVPDSLRKRVHVMQKPFLPRALAELLKSL